MERIEAHKYRNISISQKLREEKKSNEYFEMMLSNLSLEDLIALRLEVAYRNTGYLYYNLPLWRSLPYLIRDAVLKFAISANTSKIKTANFLGVNLKDFRKIVNKYNLEKYFSKEI